MAYSRYRIGNGRRNRGGNLKSPAYAKLLLALVAIGLCMYFFVAGATGRWVADNVVMPVISMINKNPKATIVPAATPKSSQNQQTGDSKTVKIEGVNSYLLQLGAFSKSPNAESEAVSARNRGAAGYILKEGEYFRVFASAYENETDLKAVQDTLKTENSITTGSYILKVQELELKVTGTGEQIQELETAFEAIKQQRTLLSSMIIEFDRQKASQDDCIAQINSCARKLKDSASKLGEIGKSNEISTLLKELLETIASKLEDIVNKEKFAEFSSSLKYAQIFALVSYDKFVDSLTNK